MDVKLHKLYKVICILHNLMSVVHICVLSEFLHIFLCAHDGNCKIVSLNILPVDNQNSSKEATNWASSGLGL